MTEQGERACELADAFVRVAEGFSGGEFMVALGIAAGVFIHDAPGERRQEMFDHFCAHVETLAWAEEDDGEEVRAGF